MITLNQTDFTTLLQQADIKIRLKKDLKFVISTAQLSSDWSHYELIAITDRTGDRGLLLIQPDNTLYIVEYALSRRIVDASTGRDRAIICDLCYTWQPGSSAASITFTHASTKHRIRFLCCADLGCSQHVRTTTNASVVSRTQLRENLSNEERVARLKAKLREKIKDLDLQAIDTSKLLTIT